MSDRQEMASVNDLFFPPEKTGEEEELSDDAGLANDEFPGKEFRLHFEKGEEAKFLVVSPKYSERRDGASEFFVTLNGASDGWTVPDNYFMTDVTILDEDEPEPMIVSMKETEITAEDGYAYITVTRSGPINEITAVSLNSWDGTAKMSEDYGGIGAELYFPMGITERTVKLPVGYSATAKDFYVTLNTVEKFACTVAKPTVHVVIPAAEIDPEAQMQADVKTTDPLNLKEKYKYYCGVNNSFSNNDTSFYTRTPYDKEWDDARLTLYLRSGYVYDGVQLTYNTCRNWASGKMYLTSYTEDSKDATSHSTS